MGGATIPRDKKFSYLGSSIEEKRDIDEDINHRMGWDGKNGALPPEYCVINKFM